MNWSEKQLEAIEAIKQKRYRILYITGEGGSGKSELIKAIKDMYPMAELLAPTNNAAKRIQGETLHLFLSVKVKHNLEAEKEEDLLYFDFNNLENRFSEVIVIDEVSMIGENLFKKIFDKISYDMLILIGDPKQLRPVNDKSNDYELLSDKTIFLDKNFRSQCEILKNDIKNFRKTHKISKKYITNKIKFDNDTYIISFNNERLSQIQKKVLGYFTAKKGDILKAFSRSELVLEGTSDTPYFNNGDELICLSDPIKLTDGLYSVEVSRLDNKSFKENKFIKKCEVIVGSYQQYQKELEDRFERAKKFKKELNKKYLHAKSVNELKSLMNDEETKKWDDLWLDYFSVKNRVYCRHKNFLTTYKSQGLSLDKVIVDWSSLPNYAHKYVAISRAKFSLKILIDFDNFVIE